MTRGLRRRHRLATLGLALALPLAVAVALVARPPEPRNPEPLAAALREPESSRTTGRSVELDTRGEPVVPDALVYWSPGESDGESLTSDSVFLGSLPTDAVRTFAVPGTDSGRVVVYSLAWQRVVRSHPVPTETRP
jgi:hypothetical protein